MSDMPDIARRLIDASRHLPANNDWRRMRYAVSPTEHVEIKAYLLARDGVFYNRLRAVPLVIEDEPDAPVLLVETE